MQIIGYVGVRVGPSSDCGEQLAWRVFQMVEFTKKQLIDIAVVRLISDLKSKIEELTGESTTFIDNVLYPFTQTLPKKCRDEVLHG